MDDEELKAIAALEAQGMIKAVYEDGEAEINGRTYKLTKTTHKKRRKIFAMFSTIKDSDFSYLESSSFKEIEEIINNIVTFDGSLISRLPEHWENYPEDYIIFVTTMLSAFSYPFFPVVDGS